MKPPTKDAISGAVQLLLQSMDEENGTRAWHGTDNSEMDPDAIRTVLTALDEARDAILHDFDCRIAAANKCLNRRHPLIGLPSELTRDILRLGLDHKGEDAGSLIQQLQAFAGVSFWWWREIVSAPEFWRNVDMDDGVAEAEMVLRVSGDGLLDIRCGGWNGWPDGYDQLLEKIGKQAHRWRSVLVKGSHLMDLLLPYFQHTTPHFKTLTLKSGHPTNSTTKIDHNNWFAPSGLRSLSLTDVRIPLEPSMLFGLRSLAFSTCHAQVVWPSPDQIIHALTSCPELEQLDISYGLFDGETAEPATSAPTVLLPRLHTLHIRIGQPSSLIFLLRHIISPSISNVLLTSEFISVSAASEVLPVMAEARGEFASTAALAFSNIGTQRLTVSYFPTSRLSLGVSSELASSAGRFDVLLECQLGQSEEDDEQWRRSFASISLPVTVITRTGYGGGQHDILPLIPTLTSVEAHGHRKLIPPLLSSFSRITSQPQHSNLRWEEITYFPLSTELESEALAVKHMLLKYARRGRVPPRFLVKDSSGRTINPMDC